VLADKTGRDRPMTKYPELQSRQQEKGVEWSKKGMERMDLKGEKVRGRMEKILWIKRF
jgi:hypothetical protein